MSRELTEGFRSRVLTDHERELTSWLLARGGGEGEALLSQVKGARVVGRCACGCASLDLAVEGRASPVEGEQERVSPEFFWNDESGALCSVHVCARNGTLARVETWSAGGAATPASLPSIRVLRPRP
ncbi:MAG TPA: hypothetical protein VM890_07900 [Longimicrobium sp.]|jgi:hypothetical protein|nr:hypothetical protein [Longimicrobium sp.]